MNVLFVSSEVAPFAKSGGLGDVGSALPRQLRAQGKDVRIVMPFYPRVGAKAKNLKEVAKGLVLHLGPHRIVYSIVETELPGTSIPVYLIHCPRLFDRPGLYGYDDEHVRFALLNYAALVACQYKGFAPDIAHLNDWQTSLIPLLLRTRFHWDKLFRRTKCVLTIHNLGHQGTFSSRILPETGLQDSAHLFHQDELHAGRLGFLMTGLLYADAITTVSPTYAKEIQTREQGVGLDGILRARRDVLTGILNGIDEDEWNPENDPNIPAPYSSSSMAGKARAKKALMASVGLPHRPEVPVIGLVSRLVWQKGIDLATKVLPSLLNNQRVQLVVLGKGEPQYETFFKMLQRAYPTQVAFDSAFNEPRAHLIEAGADMFLMPSRYEPCGLNQMYSLRYGTIPIVHKTGGLADTVWPFDEKSGQGTGFVFEHFDEAGLGWAIKRALHVWGTGEGASRARWEKLQKNGMDLPFGWRHRVRRYIELYERLARS